MADSKDLTPSVVPTPGMPPLTPADIQLVSPNPATPAATVVTPVILLTPPIMPHIPSSITSPIAATTVTAGIVAAAAAAPMSPTHAPTGAPPALKRIVSTGSPTEPHSSQPLKSVFDFRGDPSLQLQFSTPEALLDSALKASYAELDVMRRMVSQQLIAATKTFCPVWWSVLDRDQNGALSPEEVRTGVYIMLQSTTLTSGNTVTGSDFIHSHNASGGPGSPSSGGSVKVPVPSLQSQTSGIARTKSILAGETHREEGCCGQSKSALPFLTKSHD